MTARINQRMALHQSRVFQMVRENVTLENGFTTHVDFIEHPGAAAIVPLIAAGEVLLIKQYRHALKQHIWEVPAGTLDPNETTMDCARRELIEETGYTAEDWEVLGEITPVPAYSNERIHLFLASDLKAVRQELDEDEILSVHRMSLAQAVDMIAAGGIQDAKSICALLLAQKRLSR
jgi:ADP-ribose pyrophosphatase